MADSPSERKHLRRLPPEAYRGHAVVHWTHTIDKRSSGWLTSSLHSDFRELLLHLCARYHLACPAYCIMPDHLHLLLIGLDTSSDQCNATKFFKTLFNRLLSTSKNKLQLQAYDHVLRDDEASVDGFSQLAYYILSNPERVELIPEGQPEHWPYSGSIVTGYPVTNPHDPEFFEWFWKVVQQQRDDNDDPSRS